MPLFRVTVKQMKVYNGLWIEKVMSVGVVTDSILNPLLTNYGKEVEWYRFLGLPEVILNIFFMVKTVPRRFFCHVFIN